MKKNSELSEVRFDPDRLAAFFKSIDIDGRYRQFDLRAKLRHIDDNFRQQLMLRSLGTQTRDQLRRYLKASQKKRQLRQALASAVQDQLIISGYLRENPNRGAAKLSAIIAAERINLSQLDDQDIDHEADVEFLLAKSGSEYRKKLVTKLLIEPTLQLLKERGVKPSRKLPLSKMAHALYDLFEIKDRVSDAAVTSAWRKLSRKSAGGV